MNIGSALRLLAFLAVSAAAPAFAQAPMSINGSDRYQRIGSVGVGHQHDVLTTMRPVMTSTGAWISQSSPLLVPWGGRVDISCDLPVTFCFSQTATITMSVSGHLIDANPADTTAARGAGHCFRVLTNGYKQATLFQESFQPISTRGRRAGYCSNSSLTTNHPCRVNADCAGAGVCSTSTPIGSFISGPFARTKGAYLLSRAANATTCWVHMED